MAMGVGMGMGLKMMMMMGRGRAKSVSNYYVWVKVPIWTGVALDVDRYDTGRCNINRTGLT